MAAIAFAIVLSGSRQVAGACPAARVSIPGLDLTVRIDPILRQVLAAAPSNQLVEAVVAFSRYPAGRA